MQGAGRNVANLSMICKFETIFSDENPTIRVSNLAEETSEKDLQDLFKPFGPVSRIYLAKDKNTGISKVSY